MTDPAHRYRLRRAIAADQAALCRVCLLTGDAGKDASAREDDPDLLGLIFAAPYLALAPDFAYAVEGPEGVAGYLFGAPDTAAFNAAFIQDWLPPLRARVADPGPDASQWRSSDWARRLIHHPPIHFPPALQAYPAHAHLDLLPAARGHGLGRHCMTYICTQLREAGAPGLHLQVHPENRGAQAFYARLGFTVLKAAALPDSICFMVKDLR